MRKSGAPSQASNRPRFISPLLQNRQATSSIQVIYTGLPEEEIRCVFDDTCKILKDNFCQSFINSQSSYLNK